MRNARLEKRGAAYILVIIILAIVGALGTAIFSVSMMNYRMKQIELYSKTAFYLAEAGLEEAYGLIAKEIDHAAAFGQLEREKEGGGHHQFKTSYTTYLNEKLVSSLSSYSCTILDPTLSNERPSLKVLEVEPFVNGNDKFSITIQSVYKYRNVSHMPKAIFEISVPNASLYPLEPTDIEDILHMRYLSE
ncbi:hypothetical protein [Anaerosolibacter sp.]|uniref:hypothetical protein n=1 Tax=Anaerosolibacter sp. TaxID=1872527 RepID=UPI00262852C5|nr:hypothetical protein [Anaerosolibacter sp.]